MSDPPSYPGSDDVTGAGPDLRPTGSPRWVKVFGIIALVVVLLLVVLLLSGGHGPGRHTPGDVGTTPSSGVHSS